MGGKKDINRIRELIFGKDIQLFESKFDALDDKISILFEKQVKFQKKVEKRFKNLDVTINNLLLEESSLAKELEYQRQKMSLYMEDIDTQMKMSVKQNKEYLKMLKAELKMYIEAKVNDLDKSKISNADLSDIFALLSNELKDVGTAKQNAK